MAAEKVSGGVGGVAIVGGVAVAASGGVGGVAVAARTPASTSKGTASREMVERPLSNPLADVRST